MSMIRVQKVRLYPNQTMKKALDGQCQAWNQADRDENAVANLLALIK